jgi:uncharacterized membrane protein
VRSTFGVILGIIITLSFAHPAKAAFTICNDTTTGSVAVAAAYHYDDGVDSWSHSEGFWTIAQGQCSATLTSVPEGDSLYLFAWAVSNVSLTWSGATTESANSMAFCVDGNSSAFVYRGDDALPTCPTGVSRPFRYAGDADSNGDFTYRLGD